MRHFFLPETQINRLWQFGGRTHPLPGFKIVGGSDDGNIMDGSQSRIVVQGMVGRSERPVTDTRTDSNRGNRPIRVAKVVFDLLEGTCGQKTSRRNCKNRFASGGQAG